MQVPNGTYDVKLWLGDRSASVHDAMGVWLEGQLRETVTTSATSVVANTYRVTVADGQLTLRLQDRGGTDKNVAIAVLKIAAVVSPTPPAAEGEMLVAPSVAPNPRLAEDVNGDGVATSEAFPLITSILTSLISSRHFRSRKAVAPAPQTSRTTGMPFWLALRAASFMASTNSTVSVPIFSTRAEAIWLISATSSMAWAITGEAPRLLTTCAQS